MADYAEMYKVLCCEASKAIELLQEAQKKTEQIYISSNEPIFTLVPQSACKIKKDDDNQ